jgi:hypothetical protein
MIGTTVGGAEKKLTPRKLERHMTIDDTDALKAAVLQAFRDAHHPSAAEMLNPDHLAQYGPRNYGACLHRVLTRYQWQEVQLANFHVGEDPPPFSDEYERAEWAKGVFELLSRKGVGYYLPAVMLIILSDQDTAIPLLIWLFERLDPDCDGEGSVEEAFGHWNAEQIDSTIRFLDWALEEFPNPVMEEQFKAVRLYWYARHEPMRCFGGARFTDEF